MDMAENERQYRLIDQMLTAYASLRDKYGNRARFLNISLVGFSIALNAFVFVDEKFYDLLFSDFGASVRLALGVLSVIILILSIVEMKVDWSGKARSYADAFDTLARLKARYRERFGSGEETDGTALSRDYDEAMKEVPCIPEKCFLRLKSVHLFKRRLSMEIEEYPCVPSWLLAARLRAKDIRRMLSKNAE